MTVKNKMVFKLLAFAVVGTAVVVAVSAATNNAAVSVDSSITSGMSLRSDSSAYKSEYLHFSSGSSASDQSRESFLIRNKQIDSRIKYVNTPSAQIPNSEIFGSTGENRGHVGACGGVGKCLGQFRTQCTFSHFAYDDPIVLPGQKNASHLHAFFGNTLSNYSSNYDSILNTGTSTCNGYEGNRTSYWVPAVFDANGNVRVPKFLIIYYKQFGGLDKIKQTKTFPEGFGFVAGDAKNGSGALNEFVKWGCKSPPGGDSHNNKSTTFPSCNKSDYVVSHIQFPYCVNNNYDSSKPNSTKDVQYPIPPGPGGGGTYWTGNCPAGTFKIPGIEYFVEYEQDGNSGNSKDWRLTSDVMGNKANGETNHGDWLGGWNRSLFDGIMNKCITLLSDCNWDLIDDGKMLKRVYHFGQQGSGAYTGPKSYSAKYVSEQLCPGDSFSKTSDVAMCMNKALSSEDAVEYYGLSPNGHVAGAKDDN